MNEENLFFILTIIAFVLALIPYVVFYLRLQFYSPKVFIRISGEQSGEIIEMPDRGRISFAVGTNINFRIFVSDVWVNFESEEVDLSKTKGIEERLTMENRFPNAILFPDKKAVIRNHLQANFIDFISKNKEFYLKFTVNAKIDESELPFYTHIISAPKRLTYEKIIKFKVVDNYDANLVKRGLSLRPNESLHMEGVQSQEAVSAQSDREGAKVRVFEVIKK